MLAHFNTPVGCLQKGFTSPSKYYAVLHLKDPFDFNKQLAGCMRLLQTNTADTVLVQPRIAVKGSHHIHVATIETANPHGYMLQPAFIPAWAYSLSPSIPAAKK